MHIAGLIPLYGREKVGGELVVLGHRKPVGGERSKYMPHQGKQEIARRQGHAHRKIIGSTLTATRMLDAQPVPELTQEEFDLVMEAHGYAKEEVAHG